MSLPAVALAVGLLLSALIIFFARRRRGTARPAAVPPPDGYALALSHYDAGRSVLAEDGLRRAVAARPDFPEAYFKLGNVLADLGRLDEAEAAYRDAVRLKPDFHQVHNNLGNLLRLTDRPGEAEASFRLAIASQPDFAEALSNLGILLVEAGREQEAEAVFRQALAIKPDDTAFLNNLGNLLREASRFEEAEAVYRRALAIQPDKLDTLYNLGAFLGFTGRIREAEAVYRQSLGIDPEQSAIRYNLAQLYLLEANFAQGWEEMEHRWHVKDQHVQRGFTRPRWDGLAYPGKTLLVQHEQGFGDSLQLLRYLPSVAALGGRLIFECQAALYDLFRASLPAEIELVRYQDALPDFDLYCPLMSLPLHFQTRLETIPAELPYLQIPPAAVAHRPVLQAKPDAPLLVGLVWAGNPRHNNDHNRSLTLSRLEPLFGVLGITWVVLQMERRPEGFAQRAEQQGWLDPMGGVKDFADTAAIIAQLDLVIGVDTSVIHLAGALAKPVWLLLPHMPDWRWLLEREDSPWYPGMRLFRQSQPNGWPQVIQRVADALPAMRDALAQAKSAGPTEQRKLYQEKP